MKVIGQNSGVEPVVLSVIAPCFNEEENIDVLVDRTLAAFEEANIAAQLVLVDDGSRDRTWELIRRRCARDLRVCGVQHEINRGIETAWRTGLSASNGELICLIDADLQNRPEDIPLLYKAYIRELPDVVQGVRRPAKGVTRCRLFSRGLNFLLNTVFRMRLRDNKSGFLLCRHAVLRRLLQHQYEYRYFQSLIGVAAGALGYSIAQVDTRFERRHAGKSFLSRFPIGVSLRICWELLKYRVEVSKATAAAKRNAEWSAPPTLADTGGGNA